MSTLPLTVDVAGTPLRSESVLRYMHRRVRARCLITYVDEDAIVRSVEPRTEGRIELVTGGGASVGIRWDGSTDVLPTMTFIDFVELLPAEPR